MAVQVLQLQGQHPLGLLEHRLWTRFNWCVEREGEYGHIVLDFVREQKLAAAIKVIGCLSGAGFTLSGAMLLAGILKVNLIIREDLCFSSRVDPQGSRCLVCSSIIICGLSTLAIHWMIIPLALYIIFSIAVYTYLKTEMDADREHYEDLDPRV
ncbi:GL22795 [Drosophila persimilis]|uniref:GL22795 n=1 Tax=Drosophila persimilis TaxID=7234 RepID=B4GZI9_DROPE|nr:GL22795 [Drosophila persimilis]